MTHVDTGAYNFTVYEQWSGTTLILNRLIDINMSMYGFCHRAMLYHHYISCFSNFIAWIPTSIFKLKFFIIIMLKLKSYTSAVTYFLGRIIVLNILSLQQSKFSASELQR